MAINAGVNISKLVGYAVLAPPPGVYVTKLNAYVVLGTPAIGAGPIWPSFTFSGGVTGVAYSQDWDLAPATAPTTYIVVSGALPAGLALTNVSGDVGRISGTPLTAGTFSFTLRAANAYGASSKAFSITIVAPPGGGAGGPHCFAWVA